MTRWVGCSPSKTRCRPRPARDVAFTYDEDGNLLTVTDAMGHTTTYTYNARNELVSMTDPAIGPAVSDLWLRRRWQSDLVDRPDGQDDDIFL